MKRASFGRFYLVAACVALMALPSQGDTLVYEGFSLNDYPGIGSTASSQMTATDGPTALTDAIGTSSAKWQGMGGSQIKIYSTQLGLELPAAMTSAGFTATGGAIGLNNGNSSSELRAMYHALATDVLKKSAGDTFYVRMLLNLDEKAAEKLTALDAVAAQSGGYFGFGVCKNPSGNNYNMFMQAESPAALGFVVWKNTSGQYVISLALTSPDGQTRTQYPVLTGISLGTTYVCYAEVKVGAGESGEELICAGAVASDDYTLTPTWQQTDISFELMSDSVYPNAMAVAGPYGTSGGYFRADELRIGTKLDDVLAVNLGGPEIDDENTSLSSRKEDGSFDVTVAVAENAAIVKAVATASDDDDPLVVASAESVAVGESATLNLTGLAANTSYKVFAVAENNSGAATNELGVVYNGTLSLAAGVDADENTPSSPGTFVISRADTYGDLVVHYTVGGTAVAGTNYRTLSGAITIPDGATSATINVYPIRTGSGSHTLTLTVTSGFYTAPDDSAAINIKSYNPTSGFAKKMELTLSDDAKTALGSETLDDFPVLVRLSTAIDGFDYSDFKGTDGSDLRFTLEDGTLLSSEVDTWDTTGTSLVWVKVPALAADSKIVAYYGNASPVEITPSDVWSDYAGVWHFKPSEAGGTTVSDATANALDATTTSALAAYDDGPMGVATLNSGAVVQAPDYDSKLTSASVFSACGWFKCPNQTSSYISFVSKKPGLTWSDTKGWYLEMSQSKNKMNLVLSNTKSTEIPDVTSNWNFFYITSDGSTVKVYMNGSTSPSITWSNYTITASGTAFNIANTLSISDEYRVLNATASALRTSIEYKTMSDDGFCTVAAVEDTDSSAVKFDGKAAVAKSGESFKLSVKTSEDSGTGTITAKYGTSDLYDLSAVMTTAAAAAATYEVTLSGLAADTTYMARAEGVNDKGTITKAAADEVFYNGTLTIVASADADESSLTTPGTITVSRADTYGDLVVNYTVGGTAVAGTNYQELSGTVTIPDGSASAHIEVYPLRARDGDHTLTITLAEGLYFCPAGAASAATITIKTLVAPEGYNTWIAEEDGNASVADNWSEGRVPTATDNILLDGRYSTASMTWDAGENGLSATVASWTQAEDYTGTVTMNTVYPGKGDFQTFTVTGACTINGGVWTHPQSRTIWDIHDATWDWLADLKANETYRLKLACGSLTIGANGKLDAATKGYYAAHDNIRIATTAHGGAMSADGLKVYDDPKEPIHIGLAHHPGNNYYAGKGGGAIYVVVENEAVVNGAISVDSGNTGHAGGAAGSVYLRAKSLAGAGSITARGSGSSEGNYKGVGGRIAIVTETAVDRSTFVAISADAEWKNAQGKLATYYGGAGTVYFKDSTTANGKLVVAPKSDYTLSWANRARMTYVGTEGDWTFDSIEFGYNGQLVLPVGTTLHLPNGFAGCSGTGSSVSVYGGIRYEGGTLDIGTATDQTMSGNWMIFGVSNLVLNCNLTVQEGAAIGVPAYGNITEEGSTLPSFPSCKLTVNGNLTIASDSRMTVERTGFVKGANDTEKGLTGYDAHGGRTRGFGTTKKLRYQGFDSVFNPCLPGSTVPYVNGQGAGLTASVLDCTVSGTLTVNGVISANALYDGAWTANSSAGSGGTINLRAGALAGSGEITADGALNGGSACGGGGRIAIRLTNANASFGDFTGNITASGRYSGDGSGWKSGSNGTIYLQSAGEAEKCGTVKIASRMSGGESNGRYRNLFNTNTTEMVSLGYGGDAVADYKRVKYVISDYGRAAANTDLTAASVNIATTNAFVDLEGHTLTVKKFAYVQDKEGVSVSKKLSGGTYGGDTLPDCVYDSVGGGALIVTGGGFALIVR